MKQSLLNFIESMIGAAKSNWESHSNPTRYAWELAILSYVKGELSRANLMQMGSVLGVPRHEIDREFEMAFEAKQF